MTKKRTTPAEPATVVTKNGSNGATPEINIEVNLNALEDVTLGDFELMDRAQSGQLGQADMGSVVRFLNLLVVGGVRQYKFKQLPELMEAVSTAIQSVANPTTSQGN